MKKTIFLILGSALLHLCVCLIEWLVWDFIPGMSGFDGYNLYEKGFFLLVFVIIVMSVFFLIKGKIVIINAVVFWLTFAFSDKVIGLRLLIAEATNNETYIYGPNWLGADIRVVCYIGCIVGTIGAIVVTLFKQKNTTCVGNNELKRNK